MAECGLPLPCTQTVNLSQAALSIANEGNSGIAVEGNAPNGVGVLGAATLSTGTAGGTGVQGTAQNGNGVLGTSVSAIGVVGSGGAGGVQGNSGQGIGVSGSSTFGPAAGVFEITGRQSSDPQNPNPALRVANHSTGPAGVFEIIEDRPDVPLRSPSPAILATTPSNRGVAGIFRNENASDFATPAMLVSSRSRGGDCVLIDARATGLFSIGNPAGKFSGDVDVTGNLTASAKSFVIDHPLDPANSYLAHASVESSERANLYTGNVTLDDTGEADVTLPDWVEALNEDFRYQLTCIGGAAPVYVAQEVSEGHFRIAGGSPGMKVSWQLVGVRKDPWAQGHPLVVEEEKPPGDKGFYRHPEVIGQGPEKSVARPSDPTLVSSQPS
jgi:hypothetical protein